MRRERCTNLARGTLFLVVVVTVMVCTCCAPTSAKPSKSSSSTRPRSPFVPSSSITLSPTHDSWDEAAGAFASWVRGHHVSRQAREASAQIHVRRGLPATQVCSLTTVEAILDRQLLVSPRVWTPLRRRTASSSWWGVSEEEDSLSRAAYDEPSLESLFRVFSVVNEAEATHGELSSDVLYMEHSMRVSQRSNLATRTREVGKLEHRTTAFLNIDHSESSIHEFGVLYSEELSLRDPWMLGLWKDSTPIVNSTMLSKWIQKAQTLSQKRDPEKSVPGIPSLSDEKRLRARVALRNLYAPTQTDVVVNNLPHCFFGARKGEKAADIPPKKIIGDSSYFRVVASSCGTSSNRIYLESTGCMRFSGFISPKELISIGGWSPTWANFQTQDRVTITGFEFPVPREPTRTSVAQDSLIAWLHPKIGKEPKSAPTPDPYTAIRLYKYAEVGDMDQNLKLAIRYTLHDKKKQRLLMEFLHVMIYLGSGFRDSVFSRAGEEGNKDRNSMYINMDGNLPRLSWLSSILLKMAPEYGITTLRMRSWLRDMAYRARHLMNWRMAVGFTVQDPLDCFTVTQIQVGKSVENDELADYFAIYTTPDKTCTKHDDEPFY